MTTQSERENIAARWLIEQDRAEFSSERRRELVRWLLQSEENCDTYVKLVRAWRWTLLLRRDVTPVVYGKRRSAKETAAASSQRSSLRKSLLDRRVGELLRTERIARGLSQSELAERAGMQAREISLLETGARSLSLPSVFVLARALGVSPSRLMTSIEGLISGKQSGRRGKR